MSEEHNIEVDIDENDEQDALEEDGRQLALNLLKHYKDVKCAATIAGVAATSLMGLIIRITGLREESIENFIHAFRSTIDDETDGWEEIPDDEEEAGPQSGQLLN